MLAADRAVSPPQAAVDAESADDANPPPGGVVDLSLATASRGAHAVLSVAGEVDVSSAPALQDKLAELVEGNAPTVVDLTGVTFIDSTGLGVLVGARNRSAELGRSISVVADSDRVLKLFRITGLDGVFDVHPTVEAAVAGDAQS